MKRFYFISWLMLAVIPNIFAQQKSKPKKALPIGVFDSGTGGLTVLNAMMTVDAFNNQTGAPIPDGVPDFESENFQYLADQANMPYGNYAAENKTRLLQEHIVKNIDFLLGGQHDLRSGKAFGAAPKQPVKMIVVACNTATAYALPEIRTHLNQHGASAIPVIGVIDAGAKAALQWQQKNGKGLIGVFATAGTVASNGYPRTLAAIAKTMGMAAPEVMSQGGVGLAESIDRDWAYFSDTLTTFRQAYKGPSLTNKNYPVLLPLLDRYHFDSSKGKLLCEYDAAGRCLDMQLNDPVNYVRYHLVSLLEKLVVAKPKQKMNTLILGCTHYPYLKDTIQAVLKELYNYQQQGVYVYRQVMAAQVALIDPAVETAKEAFVKLFTAKIQQKGVLKLQNNFFISVPNTALPEIELQADGWFTYAYKYGRQAGQKKVYVKVVPFDGDNIAEAAYQRFKETLPGVYAAIQAYRSKN
jgi:glutamate racemase